MIKDKVISTGGQHLIFKNKKSSTAKQDIKAKW